MKRRTKIVCTLGPAVNDPGKIKDLVEAGMNVARLNCSHGDWETRLRWIEWIKACCGDTAPVALLADLQGPKFRVGDLPGALIRVEAGQSITIGKDPEAIIPIHQPEILKAISSGARLLLGDGDVELRVTGGEDGRFEGKVVTGGNVKSRQGVTLVGRVFDVPAITDKDREDIVQACRAGVDYIALSYVKDGGDMRELRRLVDEHDPRIKLCAKIETREAYVSLDDIIDHSDLIMVARGDMGLQMNFEEVPLAQKKIIEKCTLAGKPVITATQMLESMIVNPRPTRAEATDIANAILDGTDAVMLSAETASGAYPVDCVRTMSRIAERAETLYDRSKFEKAFDRRVRDGVSQTEAVAHAVSELSSLIKPAAILTNTTSGQTARLVSKFRPRTSILCATYDEKVRAQMAVVWGVEAIHIDRPKSTDEAVGSAVAAFKSRKRLKTGDCVIVTAGVPAGVPGNTNLILAHTVE